MNDSQRPLSESYWVEPGRFLAGEYPGRFDTELTRKRIDALIETGFDTFIDLTRENETIPYSAILQEQSESYGIEVQYHRYSIGDYGLPTSDLMRSILDRIDKSLQAGRKVYLHCWGGIGRTGTTVGCYLVRRGLNGEDALRQLAEWWQQVPKSHIHRNSPETREQTDFIRTWDRFEHPPNEPSVDSLENH